MQVKRSAGPLAAYVAIALAAATCASAGRSAIVECTDSRGVSIMSGDAGGSGCAANTRPATRRAAQATAVSASPASFPRVDAATQRLRDSDRALILQDELTREQQRLVATESRMRAASATASSPAARGDAGSSSAELVDLLAHTRENIRALQAELAGVR